MVVSELPPRSGQDGGHLVRGPAGYGLCVPLQLGHVAQVWQNTHTDMGTPEQMPIIICESVP